MAISGRKRKAIKIIAVCIVVYLGFSWVYFSFMYGMTWSGIYGDAFEVAINRAVFLSGADLDVVLNLQANRSLCTQADINADNIRIVNGYLGAREAVSTCSVVKSLGVEGRCAFWWVGRRCVILEVNRDVRAVINRQINDAINNPCKYIPSKERMVMLYGYSVGDAQYYSFMGCPEIKKWIYSIEIVDAGGGGR